MAFIPHSFYNASESSFTPLFRLLDDFDSYSRQSGVQQQGRRAGLPSWQPKFDIRETADNYEMHGELPGMNKDNVHIEFTDPQTMHIRGRVERAYSAGTPPVGHIEDASSVRSAIAESENGGNPHQATVEDEGQEQQASPPAEAAVQRVEGRKQVDKAKYWLTERSIGEFSRSFNFPARIDQDAVSAGFKDGILTIVVPKAKKHESRRIMID